MKKIIPAITMTLLGASLLGTSTYAWFSANTSATAEGLSIKAQADSSLLISATQDGTYGAKATMVKSNTPSDILDPVTKGKVEGDPSTDAVDFKKIDPSQTTVDADGKIVGTAVYVDTTVDYVKSQVWLKYAGKDAANIEVKAVLGNSSPADQMYLAARVALYEVGTTTELGTDMEFTACGTDSTNSGTISMAAKTETPVGYDVYVWFEGNDTDCKNLNAVNGDTYSVTLKFNIKTSD